MRQYWGLPTAAAVAVATISGIAAAANELRVESVNSYPTAGSLSNSIANGQGFINKMLENGDTTWSASHYTDASVWDKDFMDKERTGNVSDCDHLYFDKTGAAISYFTGHGVCGYGSCWGGACPGQPCTGDAQCASPNTAQGQRLPGYCVNGPTLGKDCFYVTDRKLVTESPSNRLGPVSFVNYTNGARVAWGESANSGTWGGVGTNGGTNIVVLDISCGANPPAGKLYWELGGLFAGLHLFAAIAPVQGDTNNSSTRGALFAQAYRTNILSSVGDAWRQTVLSVQEGGGCPVGGKGGINGCGAAVTVSFAENQTSAANRVNSESWLGAMADGNDVTGITWWTYGWIFNYNTSVYPLQLADARRP